MLSDKTTRIVNCCKGCANFSAVNHCRCLFCNLGQASNAAAMVFASRGISTFSVALLILLLLLFMMMFLMMGKLLN